MPYAGTSSRLNVGRLNAFRLNIGQTWAVVVTINGVTVPKIQRYESWIEDAINAPQTCSLKVRGVTPAPGQSVVVTVAGATRFSGTITAVDQVQTKVGQRIWYRIEATAGLPIVDRLVVTKTYISATPAAILADLFATYAPTVTLNNVEAGLAWINSLSSAVWIFDHEPFSQVLSAIANAVGASWKFLPGPDLWLRTTASNNLGTIQTLDVNNIGVNRFKRLTYRKAIDQIRNRVYAFGASGYAIPIPLPASATVIPVSNAFPFALASGDSGQAELMTPVGVGGASTGVPISYTGTVRSGTVAAPTAAQIQGCDLSYTNVGSLSIGAYQWGFTYITANGETPLAPLTINGQGTASQLSGVLTLKGLYGTHAVTAGGNGFNPPDPSITAIGVYRTTVNGSQLLKVGTVTPSGTAWPTTYTDGTADTALGTAPPSTGTICPQGASSTTLSLGASIGVTSVNVADGTKFDSGGGWAYAGVQLIQYTAVTFPGTGGNTIAATLTLASPLIGTLASGTTITATPALTGCAGTSAVIASPLTPISVRTNTNPALTIGTLYNWAVSFTSASGETVPSALSGMYNAAAPTAPTSVTGANSGSGSGLTNGGVYSYIVGYFDANGQLSLLGTSANFTSNGQAATVSAAIPFDTIRGVTATVTVGNVFVFRTKANGSTYYQVTTLTGAVISGGVYTATDSMTDASLVTLGTTVWNQGYTLNAVPLGPAATTGRKIYRNTGPGTSLQLVTTIADNTTTTYTDTTPDASLGATAPTTDTSQLTGVPAIPPSSSLGLFYQADDATAQSALAGLVGGTGIQEHTIRDGSLQSQTLVKARAQAELLLGKNVQEQATFTSEDQTIVAGASVPISISGISTTLTIQRAKTYWKVGRKAPQIDVTATNLYSDIYGYLRAVELQAARAQ